MITDFAVTKRDEYLGIEIEITRHKTTKYYRHVTQHSLDRLGEYLALHPYVFTHCEFFHINRLTIRYFRKLDMKG